MNRYFDESTGLYDFRIRAYFPGLGRFAQRDILPDFNLYTFVNNNPLISIDPMGTDPRSAQTQISQTPSPDEYLRSPEWFESHELREESKKREQQEQLSKKDQLAAARLGRLKRPVEIAAGVSFAPLVAALAIKIGAGASLAQVGFALRAGQVITGAYSTLGIWLGANYPRLISFGTRLLEAEVGAPPTAPSTLQMVSRGASGQRGVAVIKVAAEKLTSEELGKVVAHVRDMDYQAAGGGLIRQAVTSTVRKIANSVASIAHRKDSKMNLQLSESPGHTPDVGAGGDPIGVIMGIPRSVNRSIGGQWKHYQHGFVFEGFTLVDKITGRVLYQSMALEDEFQFFRF